MVSLLSGPQTTYMKKYFNRDGKEVTIGDYAVSKKIIKRSDGKSIVIEERICITEDTIPFLLSIGMIREENVMKSLSHYITILMKKYGFTEEELVKLSRANMNAYFSLIIREIALDLDSKYDGNISECKEVFIFSNTVGHIVKVNTATIKSFKHFAAFRSFDDAKIACSICKELIKSMYKSNLGK